MNILPEENHIDWPLQRDPGLAGMVQELFAATAGLKAEFKGFISELTGGTGSGAGGLLSAPSAYPALCVAALLCHSAALSIHVNYCSYS